MNTHKKLRKMLTFVALTLGMCAPLSYADVVKCGDTKVNTSNYSQATLDLLDAVSDCDLERVDNALHKRADANACYTQQNVLKYVPTVLMYAMKCDDKTIAEKLVAAGAKVDALTLDKRTVLNYALPDYPDNAQVAINAGFDINSPESVNGLVRKLEAVGAFRDKVNELLTQLESLGFNINAKGKEGKTLLFMTRSFVAAEVLIEHGAKVDAVDDYGSTALMYDAYDAEKSLVETLIAHHARLDIVDNDGNTVMDWANAPNRRLDNFQLNVRQEIVSLLEDPQAIEALRNSK